MPYPPKLTEAMLTTLVGQVRSGVPIKTALRANNINDRAAWRWLRNGLERPGSIYGAFREQLLAAEAEADVIDITILTNAKSRTTRTVTTVTKKEARRENGIDVMAVTDETETVTVRPPDPKWAWEMLRARNPAFRTNLQVNVDPTPIPKEMMARTIAEKLRIIQGGTGPSMLLEGDEEARRMMGGT